MCVLHKWLELLEYCVVTKEAIRVTLNGETSTVLPHAIAPQSGGTFEFSYTRIKPDNTPEKFHETKSIDISDIDELVPTGLVLRNGKLVVRDSEK